MKLQSITPKVSFRAVTTRAKRQFKKENDLAKKENAELRKQFDDFCKMQKDREFDIDYIHDLGLYAIVTKNGTRPFFGRTCAPSNDIFQLGRTIDRLEFDENGI